MLRETQRDLREMRRRLLGRSVAALLVSLTLMSGCATGSVTNFCQMAEPILISRQDVLTDGTARQILAHNEVGRATCGW
jgi:ABC-type lipoprotein release transport system permease subunit